MTVQRSVFVLLFLHIDDPGSEENGECLTCEYKFDNDACICADFSYSDKNFTTLQAQPSTSEW